MKKGTFKVRGYEGITHLQFEAGDLPKLTELLGVERVVNALNTAEVSHNWNSEFENRLAKEAEKAGEKREVERDEEGKIVSTESNSAFLKRTGFRLSKEKAQELADSIKFPVEVRAKGEGKVDKELKDRMELAEAMLGSEEHLVRFQKKAKMLEVGWVDLNKLETEEEEIRELAEVIRLVRIAAAA